MLDKEDYKSLYEFQMVIYNHMTECKTEEEIIQQYTLMNNVLNDVYKSEINLLPIRQNRMK